MEFVNLNFYPNGFSLTRQDQVELFVPYSKFENINIDPQHNKMRLELKKYGSFFRNYETTEAMQRDAKLILNKGRSYDRSFGL